jgi:hypothetical protein
MADITRKPPPWPPALSAALAAARAEGRREGLREAAGMVDCGCPIRGAVLARMQSNGERKARALCVHGDLCCAIEAQSVRAAAGDTGDE